MIALNNTKPIDPNDPANAAWLSKLQGNILSGHGRDHTAHIFLRLRTAPTEAKSLIRQLADLATSALQQQIERDQFKRFGVPGALFCNVLLSANGYRKIGFAPDQVRQAFMEPADPGDLRSTFVDGMAAHAMEDFSDPSPAGWEATYAAADIDAMILLADDDRDFLLRRTRDVINQISLRCNVLGVERGDALRTDDGEGIEHFGYVDGRSQPLFLTTEFTGLDQNGSFGPKTREATGGAIDKWNPFEPLRLVLLKDPFANDENAFGSYMVFRKLEQNVRDFAIAEQRLADALGLIGSERARAGAMAIGRFRDGTPLVLSQTPGFMPPKENNFTFEADRDAFKCPFHAHIRKTNPRGDIEHQFQVSQEQSERPRRIARRGITYGERNRHPNAFQALDDLPFEGVGLLFMCFQSSIRTHFAFMQKDWANSESFLKAGVGMDTVIGQHTGTPALEQTWRPEYGQAEPTIRFLLGRFVKMKGGEFFFAPSLPFLKGLS